MLTSEITPNGSTQTPILSIMILGFICLITLTSFICMVLIRLVKIKTDSKKFMNEILWTITTWLIRIIGAGKKFTIYHKKFNFLTQELDQDGVDVSNVNVYSSLQRLLYKASKSKRYSQLAPPARENLLKMQETARLKQVAKKWSSKIKTHKKVIHTKKKFSISKYFDNEVYPDVRKQNSSSKITKNIDIFGDKLQTLLFELRNSQYDLLAIVINRTSAVLYFLGNLGLFIWFFILANSVDHQVAEKFASLEEVTYLCSCNNGIPIETGCDNSIELCDSCFSGYRLVGNSCVQNFCYCENGAAKVGFACQSHSATDCRTCNIGYYLKDRSCQQKICTCQYGIAATGIDCPYHGNHYCKSCDIGYEYIPNYLPEHDVDYENQVAEIKSQMLANPFKPLYNYNLIFGIDYKHKSKRICQAKVCSCLNGTPMLDVDCVISNQVVNLREMSFKKSNQLINTYIPESAASTSNQFRPIDILTSNEDIVDIFDYFTNCLLCDPGYELTPIFYKLHYSYHDFLFNELITYVDIYHQETGQYVDRQLEQTQHLFLFESDLLNNRISYCKNKLCTCDNGVPKSNCDIVETYCIYCFPGFNLNSVTHTCEPYSTSIINNQIVVQSPCQCTTVSRTAFELFSYQCSPEELTGCQCPYDYIPMYEFYTNKFICQSAEALSFQEYPSTSSGMFGGYDTLEYLESMSTFPSLNRRKRDAPPLFNSDPLPLDNFEFEIDSNNMPETMYRFFNQYNLDKISKSLSDFTESDPYMADAQSFKKTYHCSRYYISPTLKTDYETAKQKCNNLGLELVTPLSKNALIKLSRLVDVTADGIAQGVQDFSLDKFGGFWTGISSSNSTYNYDKPWWHTDPNLNFHGVPGSKYFTKLVQKYNLKYDLKFPYNTTFIPFDNAYSHTESNIQSPWLFENLDGNDINHRWQNTIVPV